MKNFVLCLSCLALAGLVRAESIVSNDAGRLAVHFCRDDLVHFRYAPKGEEFVPQATYVARQAIAKTDSDYAPVAVGESRTAAGVKFSSGRLSVAVDAKTLAVTISADGKTVFRSAPEAFSSNGEGRTARFVRDVACEERFMGLGNIPGKDFKSLELRDRTYDLWLTANNVHAIIPLWYSSAGYGMYLCNSNRGRISFKEDYSVSLEGGEMNFYFVWGPSFKTILRNWSELAGRMNMPPLYALGLTYRGAGGFGAKDLEAVTREQQDAGIAVDVIGVEPGWHTHAYPCSFRWSGKFPDPKGFLDTMHALGVKVNFWEHPYYSSDCPIAKDSEPYGRWGLEIAKAEGSKARYGFGGFVPDMTMNGARDLYWKMHEDVLFNIGADGLKVDETDDWAVGRSLAEKMPSGISCNAYHNLIGTLTCNFVHERFRDVYGKRTFLFSRGNWAGMQRWASSAYTDFYGFEQFVMSVIVQSCSGSYYTPEIRNRETPNDVAYMRRAEMMFLTPFPMSNEWQENAVVTRRSKQVFDCYKKYNKLHYSLVPYIYSLFREQNKTGLAVVRALPLEFSGDPAVFGVSNEFMLGPSILVRPVADFRHECKAKTYLPTGAEWVDWWTHAAYAGGETIDYPCPADTMPIFLRRGAIVPMGHYGRNTGDLTSPDVDILVVPSEKETSFTLYEDDGISFDYEKGVYRETDISAVAKDGRVTVRIAKPRGSYRTPKRSFNVRILHRGNVVERKIPDDGKSHELSVNPLFPWKLVLDTDAALPSLALERVPVAGWHIADAGSVVAEATDKGWFTEDNDRNYLIGRALSRREYKPDGKAVWHEAVVPGTVLTSLVADGTYPEPTYGENNRPEKIPESLCRTDWWYRAEFIVPKEFQGRKVWLEFDGINYAAEIHVNGRFAGRLKGAFRRGRFEISDYHLKYGEPNALAVRISPQPTAGNPNEHTMASNGGPCGGVGRNDGPTFSCSLGWDWQSGVRDRNAGIWQGVWLSATRRIILMDPQIVTGLPDLPSTDRATIIVRVPVRNTTHDEVFGKVVVSFDGVNLSRDVKLGPWEDKVVEFTPEADPALVVKNPKLWWPNGLGEPTLHKMQFVLEEDGKVADAREETFGIRKFTYFVPEKKEFALSVNGVRVFMKGGNWGLDEMLKRIPPARIDAQVRLHRDANLNMIRNWGGQSYSDALADACDKYGILLFQEFWHMDAMGPRDEGTYFDNLRDTVLRYRNRASVVFWCALNEAIPHKMLNDRIRRTLAELDPVRHYQPHSGDFYGFNSGGPYEWSPPVKYTRYLEDPQFNRRETFKTELGAIAIPTYEAFEAMFPAEDLEGVTDAWGESNFASGGGRNFIRHMTARYGAPRTFADFVRKSQLMGYEAHRAMYEGRLARMFAPAEGVLLWMSIPSHPSLIWNLMSYDLEPHAALFAVQQGCRPVHAFFTETDGGTVHLVNQTAKPVSRDVRVSVYSLDGRELSRKDVKAECPAETSRAVAKVEWPKDLPDVHFVRVDDAFYWRRKDTNPENPKDLGDTNRLVYRENLRTMDEMPKIALKVVVRTTAAEGRSATCVTLQNPTDHIALLVHAQLVSTKDGKRVLPAYWSENYVTLGPKEQKLLTCTCDVSALRGGEAKVQIDGWNVASVSGDGLVVLNPHFAESELKGEPGKTFGFKKPVQKPQDVVRINCAGYNCGAFAKDPGFLGGAAGYQAAPVIMPNDSRLAPPDVYRTVRWSSSEYDCLMTGKSKPYLLRLHFAESSREKVAGVCKFDVKVNGKVVLPDFDVSEAAGGINRACVVDVKVESDAGGHVKVEFANGAKKGGERHRDPRVCGIEVLPAEGI